MILIIRQPLTDLWPSVVPASHDDIQLVAASWAVFNLPPSRADIDMTKLVVEAARALQITVHDHLVVAGDQVESLRALGLM